MAITISLPLETKRLILRRFTEADADTMFRNCWCNHDVWKWTNYQPMKSMDDLYTLNNIFTEFWFAKYSNPAYYNWAIVLKETKEAIGRIWAVRTDENDRKPRLTPRLLCLRGTVSGFLKRCRYCLIRYSAPLRREELVKEVCHVYL